MAFVFKPSVRCVRVNVTPRVARSSVGTRQFTTFNNNNTKFFQPNVTSFSRTNFSLSIKRLNTTLKNDISTPLDTFPRRHIGPQEKDIKEMLSFLGYDSLDTFSKDNVPKPIQLKQAMPIGKGKGERQMLSDLKETAKKNKIFRSFIGMGYYGTVTPPVILRNLLENPGWYTPYTPYQAEISQGRLESLLNYQTLITELTKMDISNASLLDEGTAAAEAMNMAWSAAKKKKNTFYISTDVHPQTIEVVRTRAEPLGVKIVVASEDKWELNDCCGVLVQYPKTDGKISDYSGFADKVHQAGGLFCCATDLLALTVLQPPGEFGADIVLGNSQRFGVPMGYGGPHAAFFATKDSLKRNMPGRLIGVSKDTAGDVAFRMSLQTREQHIRRETATSNICTAQALLANTVAMYAIYHGPQGLKDIAERVHKNAVVFAVGASKLGYKVPEHNFFDTVRVETADSQKVLNALAKRGINARALNNKAVTVSFDETVTVQDLDNLFAGFAEAAGTTASFKATDLAAQASSRLGPNTRKDNILQHPTFNMYHSETQMLRYLKKLENKDLSLTNCMIPLGSCTMKLNATSEMIPITWPEFGELHPFVPADQAKGYHEMFDKLTDYLSAVTGFPAVSLQPNSGAQGEYAGLRVIRAYLQDTNQAHRNVCLIPTSAHGTNPASAAMCGMKIVVVKADKDGNVDYDDLKQKAEQYSKELACLMITYPSTHGVFEEKIKDICNVIHQNGGQVYMDGANMNSQVGLCSPGDIGADVCHLNLHKTFCIPHGGGGPGMGPIGVAKHLAPYLPAHPVVNMGPKFGGVKSFGPVSAAPFGSSSILPISYAYIEMMGGEGLTKATQLAILNANYMARRLKPHYNIVYTKSNGLVAHEFILDFAPFKSVDVSVEDVAKRLIDYGFHAPTMAWPIHDTLMIEPTESEPKEELDRLVDALISIRQEIREIEEGKADRTNNVLRNSPHTLKVITSDKWDRPYTREKAAFPVASLKHNKYWPAVGRIDSVYGDRNLICTCPPLESYQ